MPVSGIVMGACGDKLILHYGCLIYQPHQWVQVPDEYIASLVPTGIKFSLSSIVCYNKVYHLMLQIAGEAWMLLEEI